MTYTLADAVRDAFERDHPNGKNTLLCLRCRRRKDREDFRETPWHGRAAACTRCEGWTYWDEQRARTQWQLEQERERTRMYRRHIGHLRLRRILDKVPGSSADLVRGIEDPYARAVARVSDRWARTIAFAVKSMEER
ncbi:hypothetical protein ACGFZB_28710 [Streptomyces cinerochromogenes]|uniref:Uncharacterized protein n=1 Tax=Streptomyces cinerochromogenes TaxID=66422 RepID=A0ABW7BF37_9ACTN